MVSNFVNVTFQREEALGCAVTSHCSSNGQVRIDRIGTEVIRFCAVETECLMSCTARDRETVCAICARIADRVHRNCDQCTIPLHTAAHTDNHWMAETGSA